MKKSTVWLMAGIASVVVLMIVGCCALGAVSDSGNGSSISGAATSNVDLERLSKAFETYVTSGSKNLEDFEKTVNDKSQKIYTGADHVDVELVKDGGVLGFVNKDQQPEYNKGVDEKVFELQVAEEEKRVVASDRHNNHYRYRPTGSGFFTGYLIGSMLSNQRAYYPGGRYSAPRNVSYRKPGYYNRMRSSSSRSRSSFRSGSRSSTRSGSRSGGFGFGK